MDFDLANSVAVADGDKGVTSADFDLANSTSIPESSDNKTEFDVFGELSNDVTKHFNGRVPGAYKTYSEVGMRGLEQFSVGAMKATEFIPGGKQRVETTKDIFQMGKMPEEELALGMVAHPVASAAGGLSVGVLPFIAMAPLFPQGLVGLMGLFGTVAGVSKLGEYALTPEEEGFYEQNYGVSKEVLKGVLTGPAWHYAPGVKLLGKPIFSAVLRAATRGAGTGAASFSVDVPSRLLEGKEVSMKAVFGEDLQEALKQFGLIGALSLILEVPGISRGVLGKQTLNQAQNRIAEYMRANGKTEAQIKAEMPKVDPAKYDPYVMQTGVLKLIKNLTKITEGKLKKAEAGYSETEAQIALPAAKKAQDKLVETYEKNQLVDPAGLPPSEQARIAEQARMNNLPGNKKAAADYLESGGESTIETKDGKIRVWLKPNSSPTGDPSIVEWVVDEASRGKGIGSKLLQEAVKKYPGLGGQASNENSVKVMYKNGFRPYENKKASLEESLEMFKENNSLFMVSEKASKAKEGEIAFPEAKAVNETIQTGKNKKYMGERYWAIADLVEARTYQDYGHEPAEVFSKMSESGLFTKSELELIGQGIADMKPDFAKIDANRVDIEQGDDAAEYKLYIAKKLLAEKIYESIILAETHTVADKGLQTTKPVEPKPTTQKEIKARFRKLLDEFDTVGDKTPVVYQGTRKFESGGKEIAPSYHNVNDAEGNTVKFDPEKHFVIGSLDPAMKVPKEIQPKVPKVQTKEGLKKSIVNLKKARGFTQKELDKIIFELTGAKSLTKQLNVDQLQKVYDSLLKRRPNKVGGRKVITVKTEGKIAHLKKALTQIGEMTQEAYDQILKSQGVKEPFYKDAKHFTTEQKAGKILRLMQQFRIPIRLMNDYDTLKAQNPLFKEIQDSLAKPVDPNSPIEMPNTIQDAQYFYDELETRSGVPFGKMYDLIFHARKSKDAAVQGELEKIAMLIHKWGKKLDKDYLDKVEMYIASELGEFYKNVPAKPENMKEGEIALAEEFKAQFKSVRWMVRYLRVKEWIKTEGHPDADIPDAPLPELRKAKDIYESEGDLALREYLDTKTWGIVGSGFTPMEAKASSEFLDFSKPSAGKRGLKKRGKEYQTSERNLLQRYMTYMKSIYNQMYLAELLDSWNVLFEANKDRFVDSGRMMRVKDANLKEILGIREDAGALVNAVRAAYAQTAKTLFNQPDKPIRNLAQNPAFQSRPWLFMKPNFIKPTAGELKYFNDFVVQSKSFMMDVMLAGEGLNFIPGLKQLNSTADFANLMGRSDTVNRHFSFFVNLRRTQKILRNAGDYLHDKKAFIKLSKKLDLPEASKQERERLTFELFNVGEESFAREYARLVTEMVNYRYERFTRGIAEQGSEAALMISNLVTFPKGWLQRVLREGYKFKHEKGFGTKMGRARIMTIMTVGSYFMGRFYMALTGDKRNPYDPRIIALGVTGAGGLMIGSIGTLGDLIGAVVMATTGDEEAQKQVDNQIGNIEEKFLPWFKVVFDVAEAFTDTVNVNERFISESLEKIGFRMDSADIESYKTRIGMERLWKMLGNDIEDVGEAESGLPSAF